MLMPHNRPIYELDGRDFSNLQEFLAALGEAINGPGGYFGRNLDALEDCISGGFGAPETGWTLIWKDFRLSRERLGPDVDTLLNIFRRFPFIVDLQLQ